jgi:hypothetical protein
VTQHAALDGDRWSRFDLDQQILMIGNEMNRGLRFARAGQVEPVRLGYERVLRLVDLTVGTNLRHAFRRELLRWRDLIAELYVEGAADPTRHRAAFRALLQLRPAAARQIPLLLGGGREPPLP